ncbi:MAG: hypothetical protein UW94_C0005G0149 [Parcubacteria group bacterium GW2011_GWA2_45_14]|nr:MAG: hypothetical protein UW94_C0005G0149 [Parcubacteria group bacterium GW2011_GWA2_45_14]
MKSPTDCPPVVPAIATHDAPGQNGGIPRSRKHSTPFCSAISGATLLRSRSFAWTQRGVILFTTLCQPRPWRRLIQTPRYRCGGLLRSGMKNFFLCMHKKTRTTRPMFFSLSLVFDYVPPPPLSTAPPPPLSLPPPPPPSEELANPAMPVMLPARVLKLSREHTLTVASR